MHGVEVQRSAQRKEDLVERRLEGRIAIVTGGAQGIGRAIGTRLVADGASVALVSLHQETASEAAEFVARQGGHAIGLVGDIAEEGEVEAVVEKTLDTFGRLDIMVNNAGTIAVASVVESTAAQWDRVVAVNLRGTFLGSRAAAKQMIEQGEGGRIINCSSGAGRRGNALIASYAASKFAIIGFSQSLAVELAPHGITVNAYCPGHVTSTPMWDFLAREFGKRTRADPGDVKEAVAHEAPLDRAGKPEEIAAVVAFLASSESSFITGESILVDGGLIRY
jgi:meso-butanediol dehydrogenase / (S,S)-butanediol dehydrogenase / diacetyl reductase